MVGAAAGGARGFVGLDWFNINGPLVVGAWDRTSGPFAAGAASWAVAQTRGPANLNSGVNIVGELQTSGSVSMNSATITRGISALPSGFGSFPMPTKPGGTTNLGNFNGPTGGDQTLPAGRYHAQTFNVPSGQTVRFSGPVELYVNGSFNIGGAVTTNSNNPSNLKVFATSGSGIDIGSGATPLYAEVYAPSSPMNLNNRTFYGSIIAKGINVNSSFRMNIDVQNTNSGLSTTTTTATPTPTTPLVRVARPALIN